jgi:hypothetical protein
MATFGPIASSVPNVLFDAAKVDRDVQAFQRNQLLMENSRADQGYQNFDRDRQEVARVSASLLSLPPEQRPQAYAASVQQLQAQGFARRAPAQYPGDQQIEALARQGMSATDQFSLVEKRRASEALMGALGLGAGGAAPAMGATPVSMPAPAMGAPAAAPAGPGGQEPRGIRNNNPLNLSFAGQPGATMEQHATPRFARFETPEAGIAASVNQLRLYQQRGNNTLAGMINTWAPPSENDTRGYVQQVAAATGLRPDQPVNLDDPAVVSRLVAAMARVETGRRIDPSVIERAVQPGGGRAPSTMEVTPVADSTRSAAAAAPAPSRPALPQVGPNGLTREQTALAAAAASTNPSSAIGMVAQFRQQNQMAAERAADDARTQQQQAEANRRADDAARRAEAAAARQDETARLQAARAGIPAGYEPDPTNAGALRAIPGGPGERAEREAAEKARREANPGPSATDRTKLRGIETDAQSILEALETFRTTRANASTGERVMTAAGAPTALASSYGNAALLAKGEALYNLGVLNGPDLAIIQRVLADPSTIRGGLITSQADVEKQIDQVRTLLQQRLATARQQYGGQDASAAPNQSPAPPSPARQALNRAQAIAAPNPGEVQDGFRFKGGDPSRRENWEPVR